MAAHIAAAADDALTPADRDALAELRTQRTLTYDTQEHDWRSPVVGDGLRGITNFGTGDGRRSRGGSRGAGAVRKWTTRSPDVRERSSPRLSFLRRVVLPHAVCARARPTLKAALSSASRASAATRRRTHGAAALRRGLRALRVRAERLAASGGGGSPPWCESAPGVGDYAPFTVRYGEAVLFWGNRCRHYTVAND